DSLCFEKILVKALEHTFNISLDAVSATKGISSLVFSSLIEEGKYLEVEIYSSLTSSVQERLDDYNVEPGYIPMQLVLFNDAISYIVKISRLFTVEKGNALLLGMGGSGRHSLARLAAYACNLGVFAIEVTKSYSVSDFHEDLKTLMIE